ncbi:hypothetical protein KC19_9G105600 [Ceratodon purpureus]|uniref:Uncharacterized protein n=1 Tax=Ceratodon purpureus TaxID=3225 RepID=A0A8T0GSJ0_CERPU|nr:hypothetical protein KC19_9G105600 [Ceratodon purpureus]
MRLRTLHKYWFLYNPRMAVKDSIHVLALSRTILPAKRDGSSRIAMRSFIDHPLLVSPILLRLGYISLHCIHSGSLTYPKVMPIAYTNSFLVHLGPIFEFVSYS